MMSVTVEAALVSLGLLETVRASLPIDIECERELGVVPERFILISIGYYSPSHW